MNSTLFYIALFLHLSSLILGFGAVMVIDCFGLLWLLKKIPLSQVLKTAKITQQLIWIGWGGMVASGLALILMKGYVDKLTVVKLFFVAMLGINGVFLHRIKKGMDALADGQAVPKILMFRTALASAVSQTGWWGAMLIGFFHRQIDPYVSWPNNPYYLILAIAGIFALAAAAGEKIFNTGEQGEKGG